MKTRLTAREYIVVASMLFGLFFGAGNLIFPGSMGQQAGSAVWPAVAGFCITGVGLPLAGIAAMGISGSEGLFDMSRKAGRGFGFFFTCALYLCIGPLFAIPRTATVSFQVGVAPLVPEDGRGISLLIFSLVFFAAVLFFSLKPSGILTWIGKVLNPLFLAFLAVLLVRAIILPMGSAAENAPVGSYAENSFFKGFIEGYNTMDALASLAFGIILINVIRDIGVKKPGNIAKTTVFAGIFSTAVMALIYCSLSVVGAQSRSVLGISEDGGSLLYAVASRYFGSFGGILLGITITFACLKTSIGLVTACSETFSQLFPRALSYRLWAIIFSVFSFAISNVGLSRIIEYSLPVLMFLYPLTIVLIILCLVERLFKGRQCVFTASMTVTGAAAVLDFVKALPENVKMRLPFEGMTERISSFLPFSQIGMGWIVPAAVGFGAGICIMLFTRERKEQH